MIQVTVLQDGEMFGTLRAGELHFWTIMDGVPTRVPPEDVPPGDHRLKLEEQK